MSSQNLIVYKTPLFFCIKQASLLNVTDFNSSFIGSFLKASMLLATTDLSILLMFFRLILLIFFHSILLMFSLVFAACFSHTRSIAKPKSSRLSLIHFKSSSYDVLRSNHFCSVAIANRRIQTKPDFATVHAGKLHLVVTVSYLSLCLQRQETNFNCVKLLTKPWEFAIADQCHEIKNFQLVVLHSSF